MNNIVIFLVFTVITTFSLLLNNDNIFVRTIDYIDILIYDL